MKNFISKATLILMCSVFVFASCAKETTDDKKSATRMYRILANADRSYRNLVDNVAFDQLKVYTEAEMDKVSAKYDTDAWEITATAATEEAAVAACDKKAIAIFDAKLTEMNAACAEVKAKFDAKKTSLSAEIALAPSTVFFKYTNYGAILYKGKKSAVVIGSIVKEGQTYDMEAVGEKN